MPVDSQMAKRFMCPDCDIPIRGDHGVTESGTGGAYCERCGRGWGETADESLDAPCDLAANRTDENFTCLQRAGHAGPCDMVITGKGMKAKAPRTPEYTAEQVAEVVEGLNAIITEPAECWQPTHISRDDIRTVLAEIKRLTLQVDGHDQFSSNPAETCVPMTEYLDLRSRLESAERQRDEYREAVVAVCDQHEEYKREQASILSIACDMAIAAYRSRAQSPSSNQGKTNGT